MHTSTKDLSLAEFAASDVHYSPRYEDCKLAGAQHFDMMVEVLAWPRKIQLLLRVHTSTKDLSLAEFAASDVHYSPRYEDCKFAADGWCTTL